MARYPGAQWRGDGLPNHGGPMGQITMGVFHVMEGTLGGTDGWFHDPAAQVSAHFGVGKDGTVYQWVDTAVVAWAEKDYNATAISIEHEGMSGEALTPAQADADVDLVRWLEETVGLPAARAHWFGHGELGVAGGDHPDCPGAPIMAALPWILSQATTAPHPQPQGDPDMLAASSIGSQKDLYRENADGSIWHWWQDLAAADPPSGPGKGWMGPELIPRSGP